MGTVYIISDHGKLSKSEEALYFLNSDGSSRKIFLHRTDRIVISGNVEITGSALKLIMRHQIDTVFLNKNGKFNGKLEFSDSKNVFLRKRQYDILNNPEKQTTIVRSIVRGKLKNQIAFMQRINRKQNNELLTRVIRDAQKNLNNMELEHDIDKLRGHEGYGTKLYYSVFKENIIPEWANFKGRSMQPPRDVVNAVMSFLYTLLSYRIDSFIVMEGLDPYVGYLHTISYGKRALCFDLMEEYRTNICDTLTCALFNLGILKQTDFQRQDFTPYDDEYPIDETERGHTIETEEKIEGILLTKEGLQKTAQAFEDKLNDLILYPPLNKQISYQQVMIEQIKQYKRFIMDEEGEYKNFIIR